MKFNISKEWVLHQARLEEGLEIGTPKPVGESEDEPEEAGGFTYEIVPDDDAQSPQENQDQGLFLVASHRSFSVPEPGQKRPPSDPGELLERYKATHWIFPIEAYIHGGVHLSLSGTGNYPDRQWDVSQLGFVFAAKSEWRSQAAAREAAAGLLETWNQYLSGDVWGYVIKDGDEEVESVWGFYGHDYCEEEAKRAMAGLSDDAANHDTPGQQKLPLDPAVESLSTRSKNIIETAIPERSIRSGGLHRAAPRTGPASKPTVHGEEEPFPAKAGSKVRPTGQPGESEPDIRAGGLGRADRQPRIDPLQNRAVAKFRRTSP